MAPAHQWREVIVIITDNIRLLQQMSDRLRLDTDMDGSSNVRGTNSVRSLLAGTLFSEIKLIVLKHKLS